MTSVTKYLIGGRRTLPRGRTLSLWVPQLTP